MNKLSKINISDIFGAILCVYLLVYLEVKKDSSLEHSGSQQNLLDVVRHPPSSEVKRAEQINVVRLNNY
jgi:hypothetical protein